MTTIAVCSVKGSPGATTTALALAAVLARSRPDPVVLVEADPAGGDLAALIGMPMDPGMVTLAASSRRQATRPEPLEHAQVLPAGGHVLVGPSDPVQARWNLTTLGPRLIDGLRHVGAVAVVDGGRLVAESPVTPLLRHVDVTLVCLRANVAAIEAVRVRAGDLADAAGGRLGLVLVGPESYGAGEIEAVTGLAVLGGLPRDLKGAAVLRGASTSRPDRTALVRGAGKLMERVTLRGAGAAAGAGLLNGVAT